jgi:hypothetical protein
LKAFAGGIDGSGGSAGVRIRNFDQPTPPSLNANEIAFWFAPTGTYAGMGGLLFYDATNYWWFAASASLTVTALVNP